MRTFLLLSTISSLALSTAQGLTVLTTDFNSLAVGAVTTTDLDSATTGGTWMLNGTRGADYTISTDPTDQAFFADDSNGGNANQIDFFTIDLAAPIDLTLNSATINFDTGTRRTGNNKALRYQLLDSSSNVFADLAWANAGTLTLNGVNQGSSGFTFLNPWSSTSGAVRDVTFTVDSSNVGLNFAGVTGTEGFLIPATDFASIRVLSDFGATGSKGVYFADLTVSIPEPSRGMLLLLASGGLLLRRRR